MSRNRVLNNQHSELVSEALTGILAVLKQLYAAAYTFSEHSDFLDEALQDTEQLLLQFPVGLEGQFIANGIDFTTAIRLIAALDRFDLTEGVEILKSIRDPRICGIAQRIFSRMAQSRGL
ncbi:MAG: hypothetical protein KME29_33055 [Calothrix sp. FI2-JRJ7]|jgi:hypothetical protein|nr:hypothetical protein [Calothrix sp. FI2-JRJ7]